jgi:hypothetical protein
MQLSKDFPAPAVNATPAGSTRPAIAQVGFTGYEGTTYFRDVHPTDGLDQAFKLDIRNAGNGVDDAIKAARGITSSEADANSVGHLWWKHDPRVASLAVVDTKDGLQLLRTDAPIDGYDYRDGYLFKQWSHSPQQTMGKALDPTVLALVSHDHVLDFRGADGNVVSAKRD